MDILVCPRCGDGVLKVSRGGLIIGCSKCNQTFQCEGGIPLLFWSNEWDSKTDVTEDVKAFYEEYPFPGYEDIDSVKSLRSKAEKGVFARLLDEQIPYGAKVLEVGCGTGQLSNFLGTTWGRTIFATDICLNSLKLGQDFKQKHQINNVTFAQMNLFRLAFKPSSFDLLICNGVLHHTSDPFGGFKSIAGLVKNGGYIIVGLYNTFGRIPTDIRRLVFKVFGDRLKFMDPRMRERSVSAERKHIWFKDQYNNPHESKYTIGEVLRWFDQCGIEFVKSIPRATAFESFYPNEELFTVSQRGTMVDHFIVQLSMLLGGGSEGGFFLMIGRKKA